MDPEEKRNRKRALERCAQQRRRLKMKIDKAQTPEEKELYQKEIERLYVRPQPHSSGSQMTMSEASCSQNFGTSAKN